MSAVQPQFDIIEAAKTSALVASSFALNLGKILPQCFREDVEPLVIPPLERLGRWLMVDPNRIRDGETALRSHPPPKLWSWTGLSILIGLDRNPAGNLVKTTSDSQWLTAAFLLLGGCTVCFSTLQASQLMHELLRLNGTLIDYQIPSGPVRQFADAMNGCHENMTQQTAQEVYTLLAAAIHGQAAVQQRRIEDLNMVLSIKELGKLVCETITRFHNAENVLVVLEGTRNGVWIAFLFVWLYPTEVEVLVRRARVYPALVQPGNNEHGLIRLSIRLEEPSSSEFAGRWIIRNWTATGDLVPVVFDSGLASHGSMDMMKQHSSPLKCARNQIANAIPASAVDAVGYLAAALVVVTTESGYVTNTRRNATQTLAELCSFEWLNSYTKIMARFGWEGLDETRQKRTVEILSASFEAKTTIRCYGDSSDILRSKIANACYRYAEKHGEAMLLSSGTSSGEEAVIEHAIHIAAEALLLAFCAEIPRNLSYRPLEPFKLQENAAMLWSLLRYVDEYEEKRMASICYCFWDFRMRAIEVLVPGAPVAVSGDLAVAGNGYVVYSAALAEWDSELTDRRSIGALHRAPGPLKAIGVEGKLARLTEDSRNAAVADRMVETRPRTIKLYEGERCCLNEREAKNELDIKIVHLWGTDGAVGPQTMYVATYMQVSMPQRIVAPVRDFGDPKVPTSWEQSIDALVFAHHVKSSYATEKQLRLLAREWEDKDYLGDNLRWCVVGAAVCWKRSVTVTSENEKLRFFEAGNLAAHFRKVFVRPRSVSIFGCIKSAMESCGEFEDWVIIA